VTPGVTFSTYFRALVIIWGVMAEDSDPLRSGNQNHQQVMQLSNHHFLQVAVWDKFLILSGKF